MSGQEKHEPVLRVVSVFGTTETQTEVPLYFEPGHGFTFDYTPTLASWSGDYEMYFHPEECSLQFDMEGLDGIFPTIEVQGDAYEIYLWNEWPVLLWWHHFL